MLFLHTSSFKIQHVQETYLHNRAFLSWRRQNGRFHSLDSQGVASYITSPTALSCALFSCNKASPQSFYDTLYCLFPQDGHFCGISV